MSLPRVLKARAKHSATMIFLHGLGDTGHGWAEAFNEIRPDYLKIVCPNAPSMPVTLNRGMVMPAWYDLWQVSKDSAPDPLRPIKENMQDVEKSTKVLVDLIESEANKLSNGGRSRIMIGGFSQGGAIALNTILTTKEKVLNLSHLASLACPLTQMASPCTGRMNLLHSCKKVILVPLCTIIFMRAWQAYTV